MPQALHDPQVLFHPAPDSPADGLGYWAAARNLVRLHAISPALFPMPHALAQGITGFKEEINLPSEDSESEPSTAPASQPQAAQRLRIAAGMSQAVMQDTSSITWTKQDTRLAFDPGETPPTKFVSILLSVHGHIALEMTSGREAPVYLLSSQLILAISTVCCTAWPRYPAC